MKNLKKIGLFVLLSLAGTQIAAMGERALEKSAYRWGNAGRVSVLIMAGMELAGMVLGFTGAVKHLLGEEDRSRRTVWAVSAIAMAAICAVPMLISYEMQSKRRIRLGELRVEKQCRRERTC